MQSSDLIGSMLEVITVADLQSCKFIEIHQYRINMKPTDYLSFNLRRSIYPGSQYSKDTKRYIFENLWLINEPIKQSGKPESTAKEFFEGRQYEPNPTTPAKRTIDDMAQGARN